jgi:hypothetical protein
MHGSIHDLVWIKLFGAQMLTSLRHFEMVITK